MCRPSHFLFVLFVKLHPYWNGKRELNITCIVWNDKMCHVSFKDWPFISSYHGKSSRCSTDLHKVQNH